MPTPKPGYTYNSAAACILLAIITVAVFSPSLFNDFQQGWDDQWQVLNNPFVTQFSWSDISYHFTNFYHGQYSPVSRLFYIFIYAIAGALTLWLLSIGVYSTYRTTQWKDSTTIKQNIKELIDKRKAAGEKGLENPVSDKPGREHPTPEY